MTLAKLQNLVANLLAVKAQGSTRIADVLNMFDDIEDIVQKYPILLRPYFDIDMVQDKNKLLIEVKPELVELLYVVDDLLAHGFK